eukprot:CAMPEP_0115836788 /NCGR_PEP_ID=MMETSP0287-20121206/4889_1 /TAXON_ID=412157 /ORGANISM="Chrysochromulina rotalis, Strain UIO044" /LENGTH=303 /DNA_ID=CAMNT_0003290285 /DNA_START=194 /DNA_END=1102 /DNA_ORIENTATION=-
MWLSVQNTLEIAAIDGLGSSNGDLTPVLQQAVVPFTLGLSIVLLGRHYAWLHWLAASLVLAGIVASYAPIADFDVPWGWAALYVVSRVPQSLANVRGESILQPPMKGGASARVRPSRWRALRAVLRASLWTSLLDLVLNVPSSLLLACGQGRAAETLFLDYAQGAACLLGHNATNDSVDAAEAVCDGTAAHAAVAFAVPGVLFAVSEFHVLQAASASTYFLLLAFELPLQTAMLAAPWVMGGLASTFHVSLIYGIPLIMLGLVVWARAEWSSSKRSSAPHEHLEDHTAADYLVNTRAPALLVQ